MNLLGYPLILPGCELLRAESELHFNVEQLWNKGIPVNFVKKNDARRASFGLRK
jgi:hypothetical protein